MPRTDIATHVVHVFGTVKIDVSWTAMVSVSAPVAAMFGAAIVSAGMPRIVVVIVVVLIYPLSTDDDVRDLSVV